MQTLPNSRGTDDGRTPLAWLLLGAALVRGAALVAGSANLAHDPDGYRAMGQHLLSHGELAIDKRPTAYRPPLYPLLLGAWGKVFGLAPNSIGLLQLLLGVATVGLVVRVGQQWGLGRAAYLAGILVACDPILIYQSTQVMTETLATFLAVLALVALGAASRRYTSGWGLLAGLALALATLCRPTFLLWGVLASIVLFVWPSQQLALVEPRPAPRRRWAPGIACLAGLVLGLLPWAIRNQVQIGRPIVTTTHGGYTFLLANNDDFYRHLREARWGDVWTSEALVRRWQEEVVRTAADNELDRDRLAYQLAWHDVRRQPAMFAYSCLVRFGRFWSLVPHRVAPEESWLRAALRWSVGLGYALEHLLMLVGLAALIRARGWHAGWLWGLLLVICFASAHLLYWTDMRMRAPIAPAECLFAAAGMAWFGTRLQQRKPL